MQKCSPLLLVRSSTEIPKSIFTCLTFLLCLDFSILDKNFTSGTKTGTKRPLSVLSYFPSMCNHQATLNQHINKILDKCQKQGFA